MFRFPRRETVVAVQFRIVDNRTSHLRSDVELDWSLRRVNRRLQSIERLCLVRRMRRSSRIGLG